MSKSRFLVAAGLMAAALGGASVAQARDNVYWSLGVHAAPGVTVGVGNHRPVVVAPPVYVQPAPVYVQPAPIYVPPPRVVYPQSYYVQPAYPVYYQGGYHGGHHKHKHKHHHKRHKHDD